MIAFLVPTARFMLTEMGGDDEPGDYVAAAALGILTAPFWPLYIPGYYVYWMLKRGRTDH